MKSKLNLILLSLVSLISVGGCTLDEKYFDQTTVASYSLPLSAVSSAQVEEISISSNGQTIYGQFAKGTGGTAQKPTIIYFHGDDKNIDKYWPRIEELYQVSTNLNVFIFDYQGYGKSTGSPSLSAIRQNSRDVLTYVKSRADVDTSKIIFYAFSLGGIFALDLSVHVEMPAALITENIPSSSTGVVRDSLRVSIPGSFFFDETFDNVGNIAATTAPKLLIHAVNDETIPYRGNALPIFAAAKDPKTSISVEGSGHSDVITTLTAAVYRARILSFLQGAGVL